MATVPVVTYPNGGELVVIGSVLNFTWTMPAGNTTGYFKLWAQSPTATNTWNALNGSPWLAATGATSYSFPWTVALQAGIADWRFGVYYYNAGGTELGNDYSDLFFETVAAVTDDIVKALARYVSAIGGKVNSFFNGAGHLSVKSIAVVNPGGDAMLLQGSTHGLHVVGQGSGHGLVAEAYGTGNGINALGGATSGRGISATGKGSQPGIYAVGTGTGDGLLSESVAGAGLHAIGGGAFPGLYARGGATGSGIQATGGATYGDGIHAESPGSQVATPKYPIVGDIHGDIHGDLDGNVLGPPAFTVDDIWDVARRTLTDKQGFRLAEPSSLLHLIGNPAAIRRPIMDAFWGDIATTEYTDLYEDRVNVFMTATYGPSWRVGDTDTIVARVMHGVRSYVDKGRHYQGAGYSGGYAENAGTTLAVNIAYYEAGFEGVCFYFSNWMIHVLACLGIACRRTSWHSTIVGGDSPVEYYSPDLRQWVQLSPISAARFRAGGPDGPLMSLRQMHQADPSTIYQDTDSELNVHDPAKPWQFADGEDIPLANFVDADFCETVMWWFAMGAAWAEEPHSFSCAQWDDNVTPYTPPESYPTTNDPLVVDFDAFLIQLGSPTLAAATLVIPIVDTYAAWSITAYTATAYDVSGAVLRIATWVSGDGSIDSTGADYVTVYAENSRGGRSNTVRIADLSGTLDTNAKLDAVLLKTNTIGGPGAIAWPYTLTMNGTTPIADAEVWITSDEAGNNVVASGRTDANGVVTFYLDAGTVYVWSQKTGYNFTNPDLEVVS